MYVHNICILNFYPDSSSATSTMVTLISPNVTSELYNITITWTIHPDSTADQCVVMVVADGSVTRTGTLLRDNICINDFTKFLANYI